MSTAMQQVQHSKPIPAARKAEKRQVKMKFGIQGPSGSGKTEGALALATHIWPEAKILVVDTENESASLYADRYNFDTIPLDPPFESSRYEACIDYAVANSYDVLILDSVTHQWDGEGGILLRKNELDKRPGANSYTNWNSFTPEHTQFVEKIKQSPIHIIATMRSKQDYALEQGNNGKSKPVKLGFAPIQREGFDYEFTLVFDVQMDHKAVAIKNRTGLFGDKPLNLADEKVAKAIKGWLENGKPMEFAQPLPVQSVSAPLPPAPSAPFTPRPAAPAMAKVDAWKLDGDRLTCHVYQAQKREDKNKKPFIAVKHNGQIEGKDIAFCFSAPLFDALLEAANRTCVFVVAAGKFTSILDLVEMDGIEFRNGKVYEAATQETLPIGDDDIPF